MSPACELQPKGIPSDDAEQGQPLLESSCNADPRPSSNLYQKLIQKFTRMLPTFAGVSKDFVIILALIFLIDQIANGLFPYTFLT